MMQTIDTGGADSRTTREYLDPVLNLVAERFDCTAFDMRRRANRNAHATLARNVAMYLAVSVCDHHQEKLCLYFGCHGTTLWRARKRVERELAKNPMFSKKVQDLRATLVRELHG